MWHSQHILKEVNPIATTGTRLTDEYALPYCTYSTKCSIHMYVRTMHHTRCTKPYPKASLCRCRLWCCRLFSCFSPCLLFLQKLRVLHSSCICLPLPLLSSCGHSLTPHFLHQCILYVKQLLSFQWQYIIVHRMKVLRMISVLKPPAML